MRAAGPRVFRILTVCTGNQCRSPAMELMLGRLLDAGPEARFDVRSCGLQGPAGHPVHPLTAVALARRGIVIDRQLSRRVDAGLVEQADLVLTAERCHRAGVASLVPSAPSRTFTLLEFARLSVAAVRVGVAGPSELVVAAAALRPQLAVPDARTDDIPDPVTGGAAVHERMLARVQQAVVVVADALLHVAEPPRRRGKHVAVG